MKQIICFPAGLLNSVRPECSGIRDQPQCLGDAGLAKKVTWKASFLQREHQISAAPATPVLLSHLCISGRAGDYRRRAELDLQFSTYSKNLSIRNQKMNRWEAAGDAGPQYHLLKMKGDGVSCGPYLLSSGLHLFNFAGHMESTPNSNYSSHSASIC